MKQGKLLILTGTINPAPQTGFLELRDVQEREEQYFLSLKYFIETGVFQKIIFCENSNYESHVIKKLGEIAQNKRVRLELLSFQGDAARTAEQGKGYGEGEIMEYIFRRSKLLEGEEYFIKITGRLLVDNISSLARKMNNNICYFNIPNHSHREMYDTRIYGMPVRLFRSLFIEAYHRVNDREGRYLEKVYTAVLEENHIKVRNFPRFPRIRGISASTGAEYVYTEWKCRIKDMVSLLNLYKVRKN